MQNVHIPLADLWQQLGDIPVNNDGDIEEAFYDFAIGTDREEIWHWIEETYNVSVGDIMNGIVTPLAHTSPPWEAVKTDSNTIRIISYSSPDPFTIKAKGLLNTICTITHPHWSQEAEANAKLIAAAPVLLAALEGLMQQAARDAEVYAPEGNEPIWAYIYDAYDALFKARN